MMTFSEGRDLPHKINPLIIENIPSHSELVERRRRGTAKSSESLFEYTQLNVSLPEGSRLDVHSYYLLKRATDGFISSTGMFRAAFPFATAEEGVTEDEYVKTLSGVQKEYYFGNTWVSQERAVALAADYRILPWIQALIDPAEVEYPAGRAAKRAQVKTIDNVEDVKEGTTKQAQVKTIDDVEDVKEGTTKQAQTTKLGSAPSKKGIVQTTFRGEVSDCSEPSIGVLNESIIGADRFFYDDDHLQKAQNFLNTIRRSTSLARIKIAVLDTGLDMNHPLLQKYLHNGQIGSELSHDFTGGSCDLDDDGSEGNIPVVDDSTGHGTHCTHLLLKTCPTAIIYTAKVFETHKADNDTAERISKAILKAVKEWDVDIISMSFAFPQEEKVITNAIRQASHIKNNSVLFFAAAANSWHAKRHEVGFPARLPEVIRVYSSTHHDEKSQFSPRGDNYNALNNFSVIGENLCAAFPAKLNRWNYEKRLSGTSMATPIMAGMAALVLEFCKICQERGEEDISDKVTTPQGMRHVFFECMLKPTSRLPAPHYLHIHPWHLFDDASRTCTPSLIANYINKSLEDA